MAQSQELVCMFCHRPVAGPGEPYYDHLRAEPGCRAAWDAWRENLEADHPGGD